MIHLPTDVLTSMYIRMGLRACLRLAQTCSELHRSTYNFLEACTDVHIIDDELLTDKCIAFLFDDAFPPTAASLHNRCADHSLHTRCFADGSQGRHHHSYSSIVEHVEHRTPRRRQYSHCNRPFSNTSRLCDHDVVLEHRGRRSLRPRNLYLRWRFRLDLKRKPPPILLSTLLLRGAPSALRPLVCTLQREFAPCSLICLLEGTFGCLEDTLIDSLWSSPICNARQRDR